MKLLIDSADINAIKKFDEYLPIDGVTTNPSILAKSGRKPYEVLKEIRAFIGNKDLHVQVISQKAEEIIEEAKKITMVLGKETFIKIPVTMEGVKAIKILSENGYLCTGTAVYTVQQVYFAANAGAKWVAPYVSKIEKVNGNGVEVVAQMQNLLDNNGYETKILGASFHEMYQVTGLAELGVEAATINPDFLSTILDNENVSAAVDKFTSDFENLCGSGKTMCNLN